MTSRLQSPYSLMCLLKGCEQVGDGKEREHCDGSFHQWWVLVLKYYVPKCKSFPLIKTKQKNLTAEMSELESKIKQSKISLKQGAGSLKQKQDQ